MTISLIYLCFSQIDSNSHTNIPEIQLDENNES